HWAEHPSEIPPAILEQMRQAFKGEVKTPCGYWVDADFHWFKDPASAGFADDDLLGFMSAEAAKEEADAAGTEDHDSSLAENGDSPSLQQDIEAREDSEQPKARKGNRPAKEKK